MAEHRIRLRGGWECLPVGAPESEAYRLTLPTRWMSGSPGRFRLLRRFNQPPLDAGSRMMLHMEQVPGIRRIQLDGACLPAGSLDRSEYEITLDGRADRHQLILEIETHALDEAREWGVISLVIRTTEGVARPPLSSGEGSP